MCVSRVSLLQEYQIVCMFRKLFELVYNLNIPPFLYISSHLLCVIISLNLFIKAGKLVHKMC